MMHLPEVNAIVKFGKPFYEFMKGHYEIQLFLKEHFDKNAAIIEFLKNKIIQKTIHLFQQHFVTIFIFHPTLFAAKQKWINMELI